MFRWRSCYPHSSLQNTISSSRFTMWVWKPPNKRRRRRLQPWLDMRGCLYLTPTLSPGHRYIILFSINNWLPQWRGKTCAETARRENTLHASAVENWSTALRGPSTARARCFLPLFASFPIQYLGLLSAVLAWWKKIGSPRHWDRQSNIPGDI